LIKCTFWHNLEVDLPLLHTPLDVEGEGVDPESNELVSGLMDWRKAALASKQRVSALRYSYPAERATTARSDKMRVKVLEMCHQRNTRHRFSVLQVKSICIEQVGPLGAIPMEEWCML